VVASSNSNSTARVESGHGGLNLNNSRSSGHNKDDMLTGKIGKWDQFASNKQRFDVEASFDENVYTSRLNKEELGYEKDPTRRAVGERD